MPPAPDVRQTRLHDELLTALPDAFVRFEVSPGTLEQVAVEPGRAVAYVSAHPLRGVRWVTGLAVDPTSPGHVESAARLVVRLAADCVEGERPVAGVTVSRGGREALPTWLRPPQSWEWDFWHTDHEPDAAALRSAYGDRARVVDLAADDPRLEPLLAVASPTAPLRPGDPRVARWAGIEDPEGGLPDTGGLAACLAVTHRWSGAAHLNDVATHPERRGRALARALCGQVVVDALREGRPAVTLGMYADNDAARRVYAALGFTCVRGQTSGPVPGTGP